MIKPVHNIVLGAALAATLVLSPAVQPILNPTRSTLLDTQRSPSSSNVMGFDVPTFDRIFGLESKDHIKYHDALAEVVRKDISPVNLVETERARPQRQTTGPVHPVFRMPARRQRTIGTSNAVPLSESRITNIETFSGPNHGSVVIDLSTTSSYVAARAGDTTIVVKLTDADISPSLDQRVFSLGDSGLIKQIVLSRPANRNPARAPGVDVAIRVASNSDYSVSRLYDPARIVVQLRSQDTQSGNLDTQVATSTLSAAFQTPEVKNVESTETERFSTDARNDELLREESNLASRGVAIRVHSPYRVERWDSAFFIADF